MALFGRKDSSRDSSRDPIDLREQTPPAPMTFGLPTPCPECGGHGYLEGIDLKRRIMFQKCTVCFHKWETSEADLRV